MRVKVTWFYHRYGLYLIKFHIVDFVYLKKRLVIEVDGGQHNENTNIEQDIERTKWLEKEGYHILRFWNNDIQTNIEGVVFRIREALE